MQHKAADDEAVSELKELWEKQKNDSQDALLKVVAASKWRYDKIMEFIQSDPDEIEENGVF